MANSKLPGIQLNPPGAFTPARTPGHLGLNDQGDPNKLTRLGDTPGALGFNDWADPNLKTWTAGSGFNFAQSVRTDTGVALALPVSGAGPLVDDSLGRLITTEQLSKIFERASTDYLRSVADELNRDLLKYCLNTVFRRAHFFAQIRQEGGPELSKDPESLNYRADALNIPFSYYRRNPAEALIDGYVRDPKTNKITQMSNERVIANKVYSDRNGNGNIASGDGWLFRGRGFMQVTGRANYKEISRTYQQLYGGAPIEFEKNPDIVSNFPLSVRSSVCFWIIHKLYRIADRGKGASDVDQITEIVNKNTTSYAERTSNFTKALNVFK